MYFEFLQQRCMYAPETPVGRLRDKRVEFMMLRLLPKNGTQ